MWIILVNPVWIILVNPVRKSVLAKTPKLLLLVG